jgi:hypothetical protein
VAALVVEMAVALAVLVAVAVLPLEVLVRRELPIRAVVVAVELHRPEQAALALLLSAT